VIATDRPSTVVALRAVPGPFHGSQPPPPADAYQRVQRALDGLRVRVLLPAQPASSDHWVCGTAYQWEIHPDDLPAIVFAAGISWFALGRRAMVCEHQIDVD